MTQKRPLTQRELKQSKKCKPNKIIIINKLSKQTIPIQLKAPQGSSFWAGEQTIQLYPKRMAIFPEDRLYLTQIQNFQKAGRIQVLNAS